MEMETSETVGKRRGPGRPATGVTPKRNIRVGDVWDQLDAYARGQGITMTILVTQLLDQEAHRLRKEGKI